MENVEFLQTILQLGWPAIVLFQCWLLWRDNLAMRAELVIALKRCTEEDDKVETATGTG